MRRKLIGFGRLTRDQIHYLRSQGIIVGDTYDIEQCHQQMILTNRLSETIVVSKDSLELLEWVDA